MRSMIAATAALAVIGCASPMVIQDARQLANAAPDWELCYVAVSGQGQPTLRQAVYEAMQRRRTDCNLHAAMVQAKIAADSSSSAAQMQIGLQLMQMGRAQPAPSTSINCRTVNRGTYLQTVCD